MADGLRWIAEITQLSAQDLGTDLPALLTRVVEAAAAVGEADAARVYLLDHGSNEMYSVASCGASAAHWPVRLAVGDYAAEADATAAAQSGEHESRPFELPDSRLAVPLLAGGKSVGLLYLQPRRARAALDEEQLTLLATLAGLAAIALERRDRQRDTARLLEWLRSFSSMLDASRTLRTPEDVERLLQNIADEALKITGADLVVLYEHFEERGDVRIPPKISGSSSRQDVLSGKGLVVAHKHSAVFQMLQRREPFYAGKVPDDWIDAHLVESEAARDSTSFFRRERVRSSAGVVLRIDTERVGILFVNFRHDFDFTAEFKKHFEFFAKQAALAIGNARFFIRSTQFSKKLKILNEIGLALSSADTMDVVGLARLIKAQTQLLIDRRNFFLCLYDDAGDRLSLQDIDDEFDDAGRLIPGLQQGLAAYVCRQGESLLADRAAQQRLFDEGKAKLVGQPSAVWLGAPMKASGRVLGVLVVQDYHDEFALTREHEYLLTSIASQAASALEKIRRVEELSAFLALSRAFGSGTQPLADLLTEILDQICKLAYCDGCVLYLLEGRKLPIYATSTRFRGHRDPLLKLGEGVTGRVALGKKPMTINDYQSWDGKVKTFDDTPDGPLKHVCAAPVLWSNEILGVITLSSTRDRDFAKADEELLERFAGSIALAVQNARERSFRDALINGGPSAIVAIDRRGRITEFNEAAGGIFGRDRADILGKNVAILYDEGSTEAKRIGGLLRRKDRVHQETMARSERGERIPIALSAALLRSAEKGVLGSVGVLEDLRLSALRGRIHPILDAIVEINRSADLDSILNVVVLFAAELLNAAAACIFLIEGDVFTLRAPYGCDPAALPELDSAPVQRRLADLGALGHISTLPLPDPAAPALRLSPNSWSSVLAPIQAEGRLLGLLLVERGEHSFPAVDRDVLAVLTSHAAQVAAAVTRIDLLREREANLKGMVVASNATTIGQIAMSFIHEVGNALHLMSVSVRLLRGSLRAEAGLARKQAYDDDLAGVQSEIERVDDLARRLLKLSRQGLKPDKSESYLNEVVTKTLELLAAELKIKRLRVEKRFDSSLSRPAGGRRGNPIFVDEQQIQQVLMNLLLNAAAVSPDRGHLLIETRHHAARGMVELRVADHGQGISEEGRRRIFEPFYSTKEKGIGLGLYISRLLVEENHGGTIEISSSAGRGAVFVIVLPKSHDQMGERK